MTLKIFVNFLISIVSLIHFKKTVFLPLLLLSINIPHSRNKSHLPVFILVKQLLLVEISLVNLCNITHLPECPKIWSWSFCHLFYTLKLNSRLVSLSLFFLCSHSQPVAFSSTYSTQNQNALLHSVYYTAPPRL